MSSFDPGLHFFRFLIIFRFRQKKNRIFHKCSWILEVVFAILQIDIYKLTKNSGTWECRWKSRRARSMMSARDSPRRGWKVSLLSFQMSNFAKFAILSFKLSLTTKMNIICSYCRNAWEERETIGGDAGRSPRGGDENAGPQTREETRDQETQERGRSNLFLSHQIQNDCSFSAKISFLVKKSTF